MKQQAAILYACLWGMAQGLQTQIVPLAQEENKKRRLLQRHLHACDCDGGRRNLVESAKAMLERGLSDMSVQELTDKLMLTLQGNDIEEAAPPATPVLVEPADEEEDEHVAMAVVGVLEDTLVDLEDLAISTAHYQQANEVVNQDVTEIVDAIFDFILDLINLVISVISSVINLIIDIVVGIINIIVDVIVAIFQVIENIIKSIIDFFFGIFSADVAGDNDMSSLPAPSFYPDQAADVPGLTAIFDTLISGAQALGLDEILNVAVENSDEIFGGITDLVLTTAPFIMMEFISVTSVNSVLCALGIEGGSLEGILDECPSETENMVDQNSFCTACEASTEMETP